MSIKSNIVGAGLALGLSTLAVNAGPLQDRVDAGETIRIGFANEVPWAYPGEENAPLGFVNAHALGVLESMGYTNVEPVVTEWGGLIPGLQANRFDIITGGMYILAERCENVSFSDPMAKVNDAFIVPPGNPKNLHNMDDVAGAGAVVVTGAGYNSIKVAKAAGVEDGNIMEVPGPTEILAAVKAGRADAGPGIRAVAGMLGLDFIPLRWERFDLLITKKRFFDPGIQLFIGLLTEKPFRALADGLAGYDVRMSGKMVFPANGT